MMPAIYEEINKLHSNNICKQLTIKKHPFYKRNNPHKYKLVSLTFDDGPHEDFTPRILDILDEYNVKATFFMIGKKALKHPEIVKRVFSSGHEVANHTFSHPVSFLLSESKCRTQVKKTNDVLTELTGVKPKLFRIPGVLLTSKDQARLEDNALQEGCIPVRWSCSTKDWMGSKRIIKQNVFNGNIKNGEVFLFHDGASKSIIGDRCATIDTLPTVIKTLKKLQCLPVKTIDLLRMEGCE